MSKSFFISDLHLDSAGRPQVTTLFLSFLEFVGQQGGNLYILGDLFDYWTNNRITYRKNKPILDALRQLQQAGSQIGMLWGNRDFLLKAGYLAQFGITLYPETHALQLQEQRILITHGHNLCAADSSFQRYQRWCWKIFRLFDPIAPGEIENYIAQRLRQKSQHKVAQLDPAKFCLSAEMIQQYFSQGFDTVICGHTHQSEIKEYSSTNQLIVLPAWNDKGGYCLLEEGKFQLLTYPSRP